MFCYLLHTVNSEIFVRVLFSQNFMKIKSSQNSKITLSFTEICKLCLSREFLTSQICLLTLFAKIKFSRKFSNLQYVQMPLMNAHVEASSEAWGLNVGLSLHLHPCFEYVSNVDSGEYAHMRRLAAESSLLADAISIEISYTGLNMVVRRLGAAYFKVLPGIEKSVHHKNIKYADWFHV